MLFFPLKMRDSARSTGPPTHYLLARTERETEREFENIEVVGTVGHLENYFRRLVDALQSNGIKGRNSIEIEETFSTLSVNQNKRRI